MRFDTLYYKQRQKKRYGIDRFRDRKGRDMRKQNKAKTRIRVEELKNKIPLCEVKDKAEQMEKDTGFPFYKCLAEKELSFICEVKKASPSKGVIAKEFPYLQIAKEYKRFVYSECRTGGNAKTLENALWWLFDAGLLKKVKRVSAPDFPLSYYEDGAFKLFFLDIGLLCAKSELSPKTILEGNRVFTEFKGALTEQYVNQELRSLEKIENQYYWAGRTSEIDFLVQIENEIIPIEVKAEQNLQAKSLKYFCEKFNIKKAYRFSMSDHNTGNYPFGTELEDIPLFAINLD